MIADIVSLIVNTLGSLFIYLLLLRFHMQWLRAPFRNPVGEFVLSLTNWIVLPARRVIPGMLGLDVATLLIAWLAQALLFALLMAVRGFDFTSVGPAAFGLLAVLAAIELLRLSIWLLIVVAVIQALMSFISPYSPLQPVFNALTARFYRPFRRFIPPIGNIDLSPLFLIIVAQIALIVLDTIKRQLAPVL